MYCVLLPLLCIKQTAPANKVIVLTEVFKGVNILPPVKAATVKLPLPLFLMYIILLLLLGSGKVKVSPPAPEYSKNNPEAGKAWLFE